MKPNVQFFFKNIEKVDEVISLYSHPTSTRRNNCNRLARWPKWIISKMTMIRPSLYREVTMISSKTKALTSLESPSIFILPLCREYTSFLPALEFINQKSSCAGNVFGTRCLFFKIHLFYLIISILQGCYSMPFLHFFL